tara:strand:+ start:473 stop:1867 length:1395 start_codon:yes stop_codon:yes gene_type:complete
MQPMSPKTGQQWLFGSDSSDDDSMTDTGTPSAWKYTKTTSPRPSGILLLELDSDILDDYLFPKCDDRTLVAMSNATKRFRNKLLPLLESRMKLCVKNNIRYSICHYNSRTPPPLESIVWIRQLPIPEQLDTSSNYDALITHREKRLEVSLLNAVSAIDQIVSMNKRDSLLPHEVELGSWSLGGSTGQPVLLDMLEVNTHLNTTNGRMTQYAIDKFDSMYQQNGVESIHILNSIQGLVLDAVDVSSGYMSSISNVAAAVEQSCNVHEHMWRMHYRDVWQSCEAVKEGELAYFKQRQYSVRCDIRLSSYYQSINRLLHIPQNAVLITSLEYDQCNDSPRWGGRLLPLKRGNIENCRHKQSVNLMCVDAYKNVSTIISTVMGQIKMSTTLTVGPMCEWEAMGLFKNLCGIKIPNSYDGQWLPSTNDGLYDTIKQKNLRWGEISIRWRNQPQPMPQFKNAGVWRHCLD